MSDPYSDPELAFDSYDAEPVPGARARRRDLLVGRFMDEYLPAAVGVKILKATDRTAEEWLVAAKMIVAVDDPTPTVPGCWC